ncbi:MAG: hypothetical protein AB7O38_17665, partial [Pirellulaceae bacterium]
MKPVAAAPPLGRPQLAPRDAASGVTFLAEPVFGLPLACELDRLEDEDAVRAFGEDWSPFPGICRPVVVELPDQVPPAVPACIEFNEPVEA